jgi:hypothetical protein
VDAPKMRPKSTPRAIALAVNSAIDAAAGTYGVKGRGAAVLLPGVVGV